MNYDRNNDREDRLSESVGSDGGGGISAGRSSTLSGAGLGFHPNTTETNGYHNHAPLAGVSERDARVSKGILFVFGLWLSFTAFQDGWTLGTDHWTVWLTAIAALATFATIPAITSRPRSVPLAAAISVGVMLVLIGSLHLGQNRNYFATANFVTALAFFLMAAGIALRYPLSMRAHEAS